MLYHYYDDTINGANSSRFALSSYLYFQLWFSMCLYAFYYLFNIIFQEQHLPCFGGPHWTQLTEVLLTDRMKVYFYLWLVYSWLFSYNYGDILHGNTQLYTGLFCLREDYLQFASKSYIHLYPNLRWSFRHDESWSF